MTTDAQSVLKQVARFHSARVQQAQEYDPNICLFAQNPKNRAELIAKAGQPLLSQATLGFQNLRVQLFANDCCLRIMVFRELPEVFSLNRIDKIGGLMPAGITVISGRVYQLGTQSGSASMGILQTPAFAKMLDAISIRGNESVHLYRNGLAAYLYQPDSARAEAFMESANEFLRKIA